ncbi:nitrite reductase small subunit NirD [bacterium AH-315-E07]|nr:nitrite reductase small subunit NirD [bacterium AH-315-E07]
MSLLEIGKLEDIPKLGSRVVRTAKGDIAIFRNSSDEVFALLDLCPHKAGPLSQGIVCEHTVICPLHNWNIDMRNGQACAPDEGSTKTFDVVSKSGVLFLDLPEDEKKTDKIAQGTTN